MSDLVRLGVVGLQRAVAGGQLTAVEAVQSYLDRIDRFDGKLNCYVAVAWERALADAHGARTGDAARPLEGVPVAIKSNIAVEGLATTAGIGALRDDMASRDAEVVSRLRAAGAIILGHVNMHEAALGATTANAHFGPTHNPWRHGHTPGGSSGGSGAAVAAGLCAAALGTDTLGSVRIPAAYNGVYGLKPTHGLVPDDGLVPLSRPFDAIGPLARSVGDLAALMAVIAPLEPELKVAKAATLRLVKREAMQADVRRSYRLAIDLIAGLGVAVQDYAADGLDLGKLRLAAFILIAREARQFFAERMEREPAGFSPEFKRLLDFAQGYDAAAVTGCQKTVIDAGAIVRGILADAEVIVLPTTPQSAFAHAAETPLTQPDFTQLANLAGLPAISIPAGLDAAGLPVAVQLVGRAGGELTIIALAARLDAVLKGYAVPSGFE